MKNKQISILAADDEVAFLDMLKALLETEGYRVQTVSDGIAAIDILQTTPFDLILLDIEMPKADGTEVLKYVMDHDLETEVIMLTGMNELKLAVECMKAGAFYYVTKPYSGDDLRSLIRRALERKMLLFQNKALKGELARRALPANVISQDRNFLAMSDMALRVAASDSPILIQGASGTGKELIANFVHSKSQRNMQLFLALNCSSIPETLLESELFGHERGAFTDAKSAKQGLVELAHGGTLFLDEIGEMPLTIQPKLLRFLQTGEFRRVGGNKNLRSDARIISATNKDLRQEVASGHFREDLLYRINVITLQVPTLRERKDDIPLLAEHFLRRFAGTRDPKRLSEKAIQIFMKYEWPGNVRELENVLQRAVVLSQNDEIDVDDLALPLRSGPGDEFSSGGGDRKIYAGRAISLGEMEKAHVEGVLKSVNWDKNIAAKILGISTRTLYSKMQAYNLTKSK